MSGIAGKGSSRDKFLESLTPEKRAEAERRIAWLRSQARPDLPRGWADADAETGAGGR